MRSTHAGIALCLLVLACGGAPTGGATGSTGSTGSTGATGSSGPDGAPMRQQCTSQFGSGLGSSHGRLDGTLVAIVPPGTRGCSGDRNHVHLQVLAGGEVYDFAVNVHDNTGGSVYFLAHDAPLPDGAWSEGWHGGDNLGYTDLGVHASDFTSMNESAVSAAIDQELADANHVSMFATPYGSGGAHLVHYRNGYDDGAIVVHPLSGTARLLLFHFADQSF